MKSGTYITERLLPGFVREAAEKRGITYTGMSEDWVIRLSQEPKLRWILGYQFDVNTAAASAVAQDKVATHSALEAVHVASVPHLLIRSLPSQAFPASELRRHFDGPFVIKPLDGTGGRGVRQVADIAEAQRIVEEGLDVGWAASPLYDISAEYRVILLDGVPLVSYEKTQPVIEHGLKYFNLGKGAVPAAIRTEDTADALESLARQACAALGLRLASVDIVRADGSLRILEVNDGIMMEYYARHSPEYKRNAALAYDAILATMFK